VARQEKEQVQRTSQDGGLKDIKKKNIHVLSREVCSATHLYICKRSTSNCTLEGKSPPKKTTEGGGGREREGLCGTPTEQEQNVGKGERRDTEDLKDDGCAGRGGTGEKEERPPSTSYATP